MKKLFVVCTISLAALGFLANVNHQEVNHLFESATDIKQNIGLNLKEANIGSAEEISVSKTFVQYGNIGSRQFLRFATAVTGPIKTLTYTRTVAGVGSASKEVETVYKGISAGSDVYYYNGTDITTTADENTDKYYWACYTIEFATDTYKQNQISAFLTVEGYEEETPVVSEERETTFVELVESLQEQGIYTLGELEIIKANLANGHDYQGKTFKLMADFDLGKIGLNYIVVSNTTFVLDLNGHSITANSDVANAALIRVTNNGKLVIEDSSEEQTGKLSFAYSGTAQWLGNYTLSGEYSGATIIVNGGTIENASGDAVIASAIDTKNYASSNNKVIVNGGVVTCPAQYGIRMYCNSPSGWNEVEVNGGQIHGRRGIWLQNPDTPNQHALGRLTVNGGTITGVQNIIHASRDGACTTEECETIHYEINLNNGLQYSDITFGGGAEEHTSVYVKSIEIEAIQDLEYVKSQLNKGVDFTNKPVTLNADLAISDIEATYFNISKGEFAFDLNGHSLSFTTSVAKTVNVFFVSGSAKLVINDNSTEQNGEVAITYQGPTGNWGYASNVAHVSQNGSIEVNAGTLVNKTERISGVVKNCIDLTNANGNGTNVTVNGGTVYCVNGYGIRVFGNTSAANNVEINAGSIKGTYPVVIQSPSSKHTNVKVVVNGGEFVSYVPWTGLSSNAIYVYRDVACASENCAETDIEIQLNASLTLDDVFVDPEYNAVEHTNIRVPSVVSDGNELNVAVAAGENVKLSGDVSLENPTAIKVAKNEDVRIDLDGNDIVANNETTSSNSLFNVQAGAELTLTGEGTISYTATNPDTSSMPSYASNVINAYGDLTIEDVTIVNDTSAGAAYCIDAYDGSNVVINSGTFTSNSANGVAVRLFATGNSIDATINGGEFTAIRPVWVQLAGSNASVAPEVNLEINGGSFTSTDTKYNTALYSYSFGNSFANTTISLNGGYFDGNILLSASQNIASTGCETINFDKDNTTFAAEKYVYSYSLGYLYY